MPIRTLSPQKKKLDTADKTHLSLARCLHQRQFHKQNNSFSDFQAPQPATTAA
jgi:hypothetical protein